MRSAFCRVLLNVTISSSTSARKWQNATNCRSFSVLKGFFPSTSNVTIVTGLGQILHMNSNSCILPSLAHKIVFSSQEDLQCPVLMRHPTCSFHWLWFVEPRVKFSVALWAQMVGFPNQVQGVIYNPNSGNVGTFFFKFE